MVDSKKFETWTMNPAWETHSKGTEQKVEVRIITGSRGGGTQGFRAIFPDHHKIEDTDIVKLREACVAYAFEAVGWKFEKVIEIEVDDGFHSNKSRAGDAAEVSVDYTLLRKARGKDIYFDYENPWRANPRNPVIPWTQHRQDVLDSVIARLRQVYEDLQEVLGSKKAAMKILDASELGRLLPAKEDTNAGTSE